MVDRIIRQTHIETVEPGARTGEVSVPSGKSHLHRLLICAALGEAPADISFHGYPEDIRATVRCLEALGAKIGEVTSEGSEDVTLRVVPLDRAKPATAPVLDCGESGSTLRFLLPVCGMLGADALFLLRGRLPERPLAPFDAQLEAHGMKLIKDGSRLTVLGALRSGEYVLPGNISSQYISGLLMAFSGLTGQSRLRVEGTIESSSYISITESVLQQAGIAFTKEQTDAETVWTVDGPQQYRLPESLSVEGGYSSATFFLCMGALSPRGILVKGLNADSVQGDKAVLDVLKAFGAEVSGSAEGVTVKKGTLRGIELDASQIPDAVPALAAVAALCEGTTRICHAERLRLKESDRIRTTMHMLRALGGDVTETQDGLILRGRPFLEGGRVDPAGDHRIAMAAAVTACGCRGPVTIENPRCVAKSYPRFWTDFVNLTKVTP